MKEPTPENVADMHREVSIAFLRHTSCFAVRTPKGQKDPGSVHWDPRTNSREKSSETIHIVSTTSDNLGVHLFGSTVDVDIDSDNPLLVAALDYFLPRSNHIWGRPSRRRTHRLYELSGANACFNPSEFPFLAHLQHTDDLALEVRGGEAKSGRYSLLPGSVHPSGEKYEWDDLKSARSTPVQVDVYRLMDSIRMACVAALIAPYWIEGVRNELCKALSGFMYRASVFSQEIDIGIPFDKERALALLEGVMSVADDDPSDKAARIKTFTQTWDKATAGHQVTGATRIGEITGRSDIVKLLYVLLAYTPDLIVMEKLFEQYVVLRNSTNVVDLKLGSRGNYVMNRDAFVFTLAGQYVASPKGRVPLSAIFLNSMQRVIVDFVSVDPTKEKVYETESGSKVANVWSGWGIEPAAKATKEDVEPFLDYLRVVIARNNQGLYQWVLWWVADIFQNPASKPGTALVLVGRQGAGKSFLFENILRPIIGDPHFSKAGTTERLMSKFNSHMGGKLFIQGEEVVNSNRRADAEALKDVITSSKRMIEFKGRDSFEMVDHARYGFTSNHIDNAVHIGQGDRRFTVAHVSDQYSYYENGKNDAERKKFWKDMFEWAEEKEGIPHKENLAKLHRFLLDVKYNKSQIRSAFETEAKRNMKQTSTKGMDAWLHSMVERINPFDNLNENEKGPGHSFVKDSKGEMRVTDEWPEYVSYAMLELSMKQHTSRDFGEARNAQQIAKHFRENGLIRDTDEVKPRVAGRRFRVRPFPSRTAIQEYLVTKGYDVLESDMVEGAEAQSREEEDF